MAFERNCDWNSINNDFILEVGVELGKSPGSSVRRPLSDDCIMDLVKRFDNRESVGIPVIRVCPESMECEFGRIGGVVLGDMCISGALGDSVFGASEESTDVTRCCSEFAFG